MKLLFLGTGAAGAIKTPNADIKPGQRRCSSMMIDGNVVVEQGNGNAAGRFAGVPGKIKSIRWTDAEGELSFTRNGDELAVNFTHFPYGKDLVVRIAVAELEEES